MDARNIGELIGGIIASLLLFDKGRSYYRYYRFRNEHEDRRKGNDQEGPHHSALPPNAAGAKSEAYWREMQDKNREAIVNEIMKSTNLLKEGQRDLRDEMRVGLKEIRDAVNSLANRRRGRK